MTLTKFHLPYLLRPLSTYFLVGLVVVNSVALFSFNPFYLGSFLSFIYILLTPGFLLLPLLTNRRFSPPLGITLSASLSVLILMIAGLGLNTILPLLGFLKPLSTIPLLITFDVVVYILLILNYKYKENPPFEFHQFNTFNWIILGLSFLLPILSSLGAISLNNDGSNFLTLSSLVLILVLVPLILFVKERPGSSLPPISLYFMALALLCMNSLRGWFITGHDILLEYHVFSLTNDNNLWKMAFYQDAYNACLSLTILPTYLQQLIHVPTVYIFKFFTQFIGALSVVMIYYLAKEYTSEKMAFLVGFLYVTFPTFMVDMAFLNRQGIAFLFFSAMVFTLLTPDYFTGWRKQVALFAFGTGMIVSHYSTSYIAVPVLVMAYIINRLLRWFILSKRSTSLNRLTSRLGNIEMYRKPILLTLPFVIGLAVIMFTWSTVVTKTSNNLYNTLEQIVTTLQHPFSLDGYSGPAKYSLVQSQQAKLDELFNHFLEKGTDKASLVEDQSDLYPPEITDNYLAMPVPETLAPLTLLGERLEAFFHLNLNSFFSGTKQAYAKSTQLFLLLGLIGISMGYSFKKHLLHQVPIEYLALSAAGIAVMVGQTILPASAIEYGLLRLFQQNLILLALPITLGLFALVNLISRNHKIQLLISSSLLLFFFIILSGLVPQLTGGGRPLLALNNSGLYYDSYYTHAEEVSAMDWTTKFLDPRLPIQAAHFSDIKMVAYGHIQPHIELLPETTRKKAYVYLNFHNVESSNVIEIVNGDVLYYYFPLDFLRDHKNLIYNNGGSRVYR